MKHEPSVSDHVLVFDIETTKDSVETAELSWVGLYSFDTHKFQYCRYTSETREAIKKIFENHAVLVGFNIKNFDIPILKRYGFDFRNKILIDLWEILAPKGRGGKGRHAILGKGGVNFPDLKLGTIVKTLGLTSVEKITHFDYGLFAKQELTNEERVRIREYMKVDLILTKELFLYLYDYFYSFKDFLNGTQNANYQWLTTSTGSYAYKVICNKAGILEEYEDDNVQNDISYEGGYVALPTKEEAKGKIVAWDYQSLYPHLFMQANLYSHDCICCTDEEKYSGDGFFPLNGRYCSKSMGVIEQTLRDIFLLRLQYKKDKDPRQFALKIVINSAYGITGKPSIKSLYNKNTASDCTLLGRECLKYARAEFLKEGYDVLYSDTDSVYLVDVYNDDERMIACKNRIIEFLKTKFPFPQLTFDMALDARIKAIWFFKDVKDTEFKKKNYVYVSEDGVLTVKGLQIIKSNVSKLSKHIFNQYLKPQILETLTCKFDRDYIKDLMYESLSRDLSLAARLYKVNASKTYKNVNKAGVAITSLSSQIANRYGSGSWNLLANKRYGIGAKLKYCTVEEFKKHGGKVSDIDLETSWSELSPFIKNPQKTLGDTF